jgi:predicted 3-demethylubiquinone-9 3-methyltransferase (glyoxalase superfamily)
MSNSRTQKIVPHLWYAKEAEDAARFYAGVFPDSRVDRVTAMPADTPSGPAGSVRIVEFTLCGQAFVAFTAGPHHEFNDAISFLVNCDSQEEIDRYWNAIIENGGKPQMCGWIIDKWGLRWQITAAGFAEMMAGPDRTKAERVTKAFLQMKKVDIAALKRAYEGK